LGEALRERHGRGEKEAEGSASAAKYTFQIMPEPIRTNCWQSVKSVCGNSRSPMPMARSA
jgi:hypothetical protein